MSDPLPSSSTSASNILPPPLNLPSLHVQSSQPQSQPQPTSSIPSSNVMVEGNVIHPLALEGAAESTEVEKSKGEITPPIPMVHLRVLVISGETHVFTFEPETTVGRMKELIWSMWPSNWTSPAQPPSPTFLRVLHAGRILSDDSTLVSNNLPAVLGPTVPTVIHLSVRSYSIRAEDADPKKSSNLHPVGSRTNRAEEEVSAGCKCVIM